eukprot:6348139-Prymnesium_polylepis.1
MCAKTKAKETRVRARLSDNALDEVHILDLERLALCVSRGKVGRAKDRREHGFGFLADCHDRIL